MKTKETLTTEARICHSVARPTRLFLVVFTLGILHVVSATIATAAVSTCDNIGNKSFPYGMDSYDIHMDLVTYKGAFVSNSTDSRASLEDGQYKVRLRGWLYYKPNASGEVKNSKVLIYNHGHEAGREEPCEIARNFVNNGYVVFAPLRRGHFANPPDPQDPLKEGWSELRSTGIHIDTYINKCLRSPLDAAFGDRPHLYAGSSYCRSDSVFGGVYDENAIDTDYLRRQHIDIRDQIEYIVGRKAIGTTGKLADPDLIAVIGHSYGGSAVIFANQFDYGQNVTIAISAAEKSWSPQNPYWERELKDAMQDQARPIFFLQPKNGKTLEPTKVLFSVAVNKEYRSQAAIFPPAPCRDEPDDGVCDGNVKTEWEQIHGTFITQAEQVKKWAPAARNFITRNAR